MSTLQPLQYPEEYKVLRKLYDIFTYEQNLLEYIRPDEMRREIENYIHSFIEDYLDISTLGLSNFEEKYDKISRFLKPYHIRLLSFYHSDFDDDEMYKISQLLGNKNNNLERIYLCEYIADHIYNYI